MMDRHEFKAGRKKLGFSQRSLAETWNMGANGGRSIRRWESDERPLNPIAAYAMEMMLDRDGSGASHAA